MGVPLAITMYTRIQRYWLEKVHSYLFLETYHFSGWLVQYPKLAVSFSPFVLYIQFWKFSNYKMEFMFRDLELSAEVIKGFYRKGISYGVF